MKTNKRLCRKLAIHAISGAVVFSLMKFPVTATEKNNPVNSSGDPAKKDRNTGKRSARKTKPVKIYPDPFTRAFHVVSNNTNEGRIDFYVFDLDASLINNHRLEPGEHIKIRGLEKGTYMYQVFDGDEMTESGKLEVK